MVSSYNRMVCPVWQSVSAVGDRGFTRKPARCRQSRAAPMFLTMNVSLANLSCWNGRGIKGMPARYRAASACMMCSPSLQFIAREGNSWRRVPNRLRRDEKIKRPRSRSAAARQIVDSGAKTFNRAPTSSSRSWPISRSFSLRRRFISWLGISSEAAKRSTGLLERNRCR
jgi:hypothetical protein